MKPCFVDYPKYFFALCRTRESNTLLLIGLWAVWKGFIIVYEGLVSLKHIVFDEKNLTFTYNSQTSIKNDLIPSSFFPSCNSTNFISIVNQYIYKETKVTFTSWCNKSRHRPLIELVYGLEIPVEGLIITAIAINNITHIVFSLRITSSITSRLALAII